MAARVDLLDPSTLPDRLASVDALDEFMTRPSRALVDDLGGVGGDLMILGVAGKMGPTLARLAKRAAPSRTSCTGPRLLSPQKPEAPPMRTILSEVAGFTCRSIELSSCP